MARKKSTPTDAGVSPDSLVRQAAGSYRSADGRFEVRQSESSWFLLDTQQTNEFGQELIHGPFNSLKRVRESMSGARVVAPLFRGKPARVRKQPPAPPPPTWIEQLPADEAAEVRALIRALEREGLGDAEGLVRTDRDGARPIVAARLIQRRLDALLEELPQEERERARELLGRAAEVLARLLVGTDQRVGGPRLRCDGHRIDHDDEWEHHYGSARDAIRVAPGRSSSGRT